MVMEIREDRCSWDLNLGLTPETDLQLHYGFIDYAKAFDCVGHNKLWKILKEMGIPDHLTCLLRNLYVFGENKALGNYISHLPCTGHII